MAATLSPKNITRKELLAIVRFTRQYRHYLLEKQFTICTDHSSLTWLLNFKEPQGQLARWIDGLSKCDMKLAYRAGNRHSNADVLCKKPEPAAKCDAYSSGVPLANLHCGGCRYCERADSRWGGAFTQEVDDAVPLTSQTLA